MISTSPIRRSWRAARSMSSSSMPLTSRKRSTARPANTRPSASSARPALVVNVVKKLWPAPRRDSTACSMRCAAAGSSHAPKARTRSGTAPDTTMLVSPKISGSSVPAAHATSTCGCASISVLSRSISPRSMAASSSAADCAAAVVRRVRSSTKVASIAKQTRERVSVSAPSCSRVTAMPSMRASAARAGVSKATQRTAKAKAARNPPRSGREHGLSFAVRIVSGITTCPRNASGVRRATRESGDFTPAGSRAERVQIVNGSGKRPRKEVILSRRAWSCLRY